MKCRAMPVPTLDDNHELFTAIKDCWQARVQGIEEANGGRRDGLTHEEEQEHWLSRRGHGSSKRKEEIEYIVHGKGVVPIAQTRTGGAGAYEAHASTLGDPTALVPVARCAFILPHPGPRAALAAARIS